jgi:hypothetical protein
MTFSSHNIKQSKGIYGSIVRLNLSARLISHGTVFFLITKQHQLAYHLQKPSAEQRIYRLIAAPHTIVIGPRISASVSHEKMLQERFWKHLEVN